MIPRGFGTRARNLRCLLGLQTIQDDKRFHFLYSLAFAWPSQAFKCMAWTFEGPIEISLSVLRSPYPLIIGRSSLACKILIKHPRK